MLGSLSDADDAVQEAWLRLDRSGAGGVENLRGRPRTPISHGNARWWRRSSPPRGRLLLVLRFTIARGRIVAIEAVGDPDRLSRLELGVPADWPPSAPAGS